MIFGKLHVRLGMKDEQWNLVADLPIYVRKALDLHIFKRTSRLNKSSELSFLGLVLLVRIWRKQIVKKPNFENF